MAWSGPLSSTPAFGWTACSSGPLRQQDSDLHRFLTGKRVSLRLLNSLPIFEALARGRAEAIVKLLSSVEKDDAEDDDPVGELGLDAVPTRRPRMAIRVATKRYSGTHAEIAVNVDGFEPWTPRILLNACSAAVAIEVTDQSLATLWRIAQVQRGRVVPEPRPVAEKPPRGAQGSRVYWRGDRRRWILKCLRDEESQTMPRRGRAASSSTASSSPQVSDSQQASGLLGPGLHRFFNVRGGGQTEALRRPSPKRYWTLIRKPSDEAPDSNERRRQAAVSKKQALSMAALPLPAEEADLGC